MRRPQYGMRRKPDGDPSLIWRPEAARDLMGREQYSRLKRAFISPDFQTSVVHCGVVNAFSNPNITMCVELLEELQASGMTDFVPEDIARTGRAFGK
jgi:hypothetical protein